MTNKKPAGKGDKIKLGTEDPDIPKKEESQRAEKSDNSDPGTVSYKIGTYNVQNFFDRVKDWSAEYLDPWSRFETRAKAFNEVNLIADRIKKSEPHTLALQEIESHTTLVDFNRGHLFPSQQRRTSNIYYSPRSGVCSIQGNDSRGIDLGVLSTRQFPIGRVISHRFKTGEHGRPIFSRDCLQVEILYDETIGHANVPAKPSKELPPLLTIFICHFKSKYTGLRPDDFQVDTSNSVDHEREEEALNDWDENEDENLSFHEAYKIAQGNNSQRRRSQAQAVADIVKEFEEKSKHKRYIVLGDFNDTPKSSSLNPLLSHSQRNLGLLDAMEYCAGNKNGECLFGSSTKKTSNKNKLAYNRDNSKKPYTGSNAEHPAGGNRADTKPYHTHKWAKDEYNGLEKSEFSQIDYILLSKQLRLDFNLKQVQVERRGSTQGSDHFLYWAEFGFDPGKLFKKK